MFSAIGSINSAFQGQQSSAANARALSNAPTSANGPTAASAAAQSSMALKTGTDGRSLVATDLQPAQRVDDKTAVESPGLARQARVSGEGQTQSRSSTGSADEADAEPASAGKAGLQAKLDETELKLIQDLASRDREVRTHEQAHASIGGAYAGAPSYTYTKGPDGKQYATGGEVSIDTGAIEGDPDATIEKMQQVIRAALAPAEPSGQDRKVAAAASQAINAARAELAAMEEEADISQKAEGSVASSVTGSQEPSVSDSSESRASASSSDASAAAIPAGEASIQSREKQFAIATYQQIFTAA